MPLYMCNSAKDAIDGAAKQKIASDITDIHCRVTGAPPQFVHAFFLEEAKTQPLNGKTAVLFGSIRAGRTDGNKEKIVAEVRQSVQKHTGIPLEEIGMVVADVPASWVLEGGEIMPEPGQEEEWLAKHKSKPAAE